MIKALFCEDTTNRQMLCSFAKKWKMFLPFILFADGSSYPIGHEKWIINVKIMFSHKQIV